MQAHPPVRLRPPRRPIQEAAALGGAFGAGLLPLLYLPLRAGQAAMTDWDHPATFAGFWRLITGEDYHYLLFQRTGLETVAALAQNSLILAFGLGLLALPLILLGVAQLWREQRAWTCAGLLIVALHLAYTAVYAATDTQPYALPTVLVLSGWLAVGLAESARLLTCRSPRAAGALPILAGIFLLANSGGALLLAPAGTPDILPGAIPPAEDAPAFLARLAGALPPDAVLLTTADGPTFAQWYTRYVAGSRPDVLTLDVRLLNQPWYRANVSAYNPTLEVPLRDAPGDLPALIAALTPRRAVLALQATLAAPPGWRWQPRPSGLWQAVPP